MGIQHSDDLPDRTVITRYNNSTRSLGLKAFSVRTENQATHAIDLAKNALAKLSAHRSAYGAMQNRLEHTINNVDNVVENTTAAESRIRDTDMAAQMVEFTKDNVLSQAGTAMLAQANQSSQNVLSLLR